MIVTTEITAVTPTIMPTSVKAVRNLFWRRLLAATLNASHKVDSRSMTVVRNRCLRAIAISLTTADLMMLVSSRLNITLGAASCQARAPLAAGAHCAAIDKDVV